MKKPMIAFSVGVLFGLGLCVSEMIDPARVIGFLDVTGRWDATLLLVMVGAIAVAATLFPYVLRRGKPVCENKFHLPAKTKIDKRLIAGAALFGVGWGIAGLCPGPALAAMATGSREVFLFVIAMVLGQLFIWAWESRADRKPSKAPSSTDGPR